MEPIRQSLVVDASPVLAFEVFTLGMGSWWDAGYTPDPDSFGGIAIGPEVDAPVSMVHGESSYTGRQTVTHSSPASTLATGPEASVESPSRTAAVNDEA
jgi:hypothetical protein